MMNKEKKKIYIEEMKNFFNSKSSIFVTHYQGLTVKEIDNLKSEMRKHGILFKVTKNRITKLALDVIRHPENQLFTIRPWSFAKTWKNDIIKLKSFGFVHGHNLNGIFIKC